MPGTDLIFTISRHFAEHYASTLPLTVVPVPMLIPDDVFFWQTALSWMMWNFRVAGLLCGSTVICYSGHPMYPDADRLWQLIETEGVTYFGTSPGHLLACRKAGLHPGAEHNLSRLRALGSTGSGSGGSDDRSPRVSFLAFFSVPPSTVTKLGQKPFTQE